MASHATMLSIAVPDTFHHLSLVHVIDDVGAEHYEVIHTTTDDALGEWALRCVKSQRGIKHVHQALGTLQRWYYYLTPERN